MSVGRRMVEQDYFSRSPAESLSDMSVDPAFPVAMAKRGSRRSDRELVRNEVVVRYGVRCEMREIAKPEGPHVLGAGPLVDLHPDVP